MLAAGVVLGVLSVGAVATWGRVERGSDLSWSLQDASGRSSARTLPTTLRQAWSIELEPNGQGLRGDVVVEGLGAERLRIGDRVVDLDGTLIGPAPPPGAATDGDRAVLVAGGEVLVLDATGRVIARSPTDEPVVATLLVHDGVVVARRVDGSLVGLDVADGRRRFETEPLLDVEPVGEGWARVATAGGGEALLDTGTGTVVTYPSSLGLAPPSDLVVRDDVLYGLVPSFSGAEGDGRTALDLRTGETLWRVRGPLTRFEDVIEVAAQDVVVVDLTNTSHAVAWLDPADGSSRGMLRLPPNDSGAAPSVGADGTVAALSGASDVLLVTPDGTAWTTSVPGARTVQHAGDVVVAIGTSQAESVTATLLDAATGAVRGVVELPSAAPASSPSRLEGVLEGELAVRERRAPLGDPDGWRWYRLDAGSDLHRDIPYLHWFGVTELADATWVGVVAQARRTAAPLVLERGLGPGTAVLRRGHRSSPLVGVGALNGDRAVASEDWVVLDTDVGAVVAAVPADGATADVRVRPLGDAGASALRPVAVIDDLVLGVSDGAGRGQLRAVDAATGRAAWTARGGLSITPLGAAAAGNRLPGDGLRYAAGADHAVLTEAARVQRLNLRAGGVAWTTSLDALPVAPPVLVGDVVVVLVADALVGLGTTDGVERWRMPVPAPARAITGAGDELLVGTTSGVVVRVTVTAQGPQLGSPLAVDGPVDGLLVHDGHLVVLTERGVLTAFLDAELPTPGDEVRVP